MKSNVLKKGFAILVGMTIVLTFTACGQSLTGELGKNRNQQNPFATVPVDMWQKIDTQGSSDHWLLGTQSFTIDKNTGMLKVSFDVPFNIFGGTVSYPIDKIPGASVSVDLNPNNGKWQLSFNIPISALVKGVGIVGPKTLPNGDPLPGVPGGEPPRLGVHYTKNKLDLFIYGNVKYFALFFQTPDWDKYIAYLGNLTVPLKNKDKTKIVGYFATVMAKNGHSSGLFISVVFPPELSALLDQIF